LVGDTPNSLIADTTVSAGVQHVAKYNTHKFSFVVNAINIHPVLVMEEYDRIFYIEVRFNLRLMLQL